MKYKRAQRGGARCATTKALCQWTNNRGERYDGECGGDKRKSQDKTQYHAERAKAAQSEADVPNIKPNCSLLKNINWTDGFRQIIDLTADDAPV